MHTSGIILTSRNYLWKPRRFFFFKLKVAIIADEGKFDGCRLFYIHKSATIMPSAEEVQPREKELLTQFYSASLLRTSITVSFSWGTNSDMRWLRWMARTAQGSITPLQPPREDLYSTETRQKPREVQAERSHPAPGPQHPGSSADCSLQASPLVNHPEGLLQSRAVRQFQVQKYQMHLLITQNLQLQSSCLSNSPYPFIPLAISMHSSVDD